MQTLELSYKEAKSLEFDFTALSYYKSAENQYAYKIEGMNQDWIDLGTKHSLNLNLLNPGNYTLRIKASNHHGGHREKDHDKRRPSPIR